MGTITLTLPVNGTTADAGLVATDLATLQTLLNGNLDNNNVAAGAAIALSKLAGGYTAYTPVLTSNGGGAPALGNASPVIARYLQIGKLVHYYGVFTQGTTTSYGLGTLFISLPVTAANNTCQGSGTAFHAATTAQYLTAPSLVDTGRFQILIPNGYGGASAAVSGGSNYPWAWGAGDNIAWNLTYEAA